MPARTRENNEIIGGLEKISELRSISPIERTFGLALLKCAQITGSLASVRVQNLAAEAGYSRSMFYKNFPSSLGFIAALYPKVAMLGCDLFLDVFLKYDKDCKTFSQEAIDLIIRIQSLTDDETFSILFEKHFDSSWRKMNGRHLKHMARVLHAVIDSASGPDFRKLTYQEAESYVEIIDERILGIRLDPQRSLHSQKEKQILADLAFRLLRK